MGCLPQALAGIAASCDTNLAGIKKVWIGEFENFTVTVDATAHTIDAVSGTTGAKLYSYSFAKQTGSLNSEITIDEANGVRYYTNTITLQFNKMEARKHLEMQALAAGQLVIIVLDNNGKYWYVGYDNYVSASAETAASGQSFGDLNGYSLTLDAMSAYLPFEIEYDTFEDFIQDPA